MSSADDIINSLGGAIPIATFVRTTPNAVRCWKYRGKIPYKYWKRLIDLAHRSRVPLTLDKLWELHA